MTIRPVDSATAFTARVKLLIGSVVITAVAALIDVPLMKFAAFEQTADGKLVITLGWRHGGRARVRNQSMSGFAMLAAYDLNADGVVNASATEANDNAPIRLAASWLLRA